MEGLSESQNLLIEFLKAKQLDEAAVIQKATEIVLERKLEELTPIPMM